MPGDLLQEGGGRPHEHARVPEVTLFPQKALGVGQRGLLHESIHGADGAIGHGPGANVAEPGVGAGGNDAEGDQASAAGRLDGLLQVGVELRHVADDMVRRQDHHQGIALLFPEHEGRESNGWRGRLPLPPARITAKTGLFRMASVGFGMTVSLAVLSMEFAAAPSSLTPKGREPIHGPAAPRHFSPMGTLLVPGR